MEPLIYRGSQGTGNFFCTAEFGLAVGCFLSYVSRYMVYGVSIVCIDWWKHMELQYASL